jgi:hypothetical protein
VLGLGVLVLTLFAAPFAWPQEPEDKAATEKSAPEKKAVLRGGRCELTTCVNKVLYFSNLAQPTELQDVVNTLRIILEINRVTQIPGVRAIVLQGTPEQVANAEKIASEIDNAKRRFGVGYRLDFKLIVSDGGGKPVPRNYSVLTQMREPAKVAIATRPPVPPTQGEDEKSKPVVSENGQLIECRVLSENDHGIELRLQAELADSAGGSGVPPQFRTEGTFSLDLSKPTVVSRFDDPRTGRTYQLEVTATRINEKQ